MDFTIQKAVELGVTTISPLLAQRCNIKLCEKRQQKLKERWNKIIISACEQCGRNSIPLLNPILSLPEWFEKTTAEAKIILHIGGDKKLSELSAQKKSFALLIGSEGGFSEAEIFSAKQHGFIPIQLGPRILRAETAALATISILQACS